MTLLQLKYFQTVCSLGSVTKASSALCVSQPAISTAIKELEKEFSIQLFSRIGKNMKLTKEGKVLLELCNDLLKRADNASQVMLDMAHKRNRIRLGITPMLCLLIMPQLYRSFTSRYPDIALEATEDGRYPLFEKFENDELDAVIMSEGKNNLFSIKTSYHRLPIANLHFSCCMAPDHRLADQSSVTPEDIGDDPIVTFPSSYQYWIFVNRMFDEAGVKPNIVFCSEQLSTIHEMVTTCGMVTFLYTELQPHLPDLRFIPLDTDTSVDIYLLWRNDSFVFSGIPKLVSCIENIQLG